ncbi:hypothetical protein [Manganibacter manganicus]|uniref:Uncharacterized protein n=1 Tax=Manganibacter manganicus TaxID=1873176 RepID=A0A1V8RJF2_9HYPH|nr:hypothetical protein [Pseudaminobacter manganicus]OQM73236.1 hypothetical protein BFN67_09585 [Pseudaminobacter manganicus]
MGRRHRRSLEVIEQISYLLFMRGLDDAEQLAATHAGPHPEVRAQRASKDAPHSAASRLTLIAG